MSTNKQLAASFAVFFKANPEVLAEVLVLMAARKPKAVVAVKPKVETAPKAAKNVVQFTGQIKSKASTKPAKKSLIVAACERQAASWDVEAAAVKAAADAGIVGAKPRVDLLTANMWQAKGFRIKTGSAAIRVKKPGSKGLGMPLFHSTQVEQVSA